MPIPVGRSGDVDGEGGTADGYLYNGSLVRPGWTPHIHTDYQLREWLVEIRVQPRRSLCWTGPAIPRFLAVENANLFPAIVEPFSSLAELPNDADSDGTDGS
jgi:hypothetical protein